MLKIISITKQVNNGETLLVPITTGMLNEIKQRPDTYKQEYHGNGKNAWYITHYVVRFDNGFELHVIKQSIRYSYRWHKTRVTINGRIATKQAYKNMDELFAGELKERGKR